MQRELVKKYDDMKLKKDKYTTRLHIHPKLIISTYPPDGMVGKDTCYEDLWNAGWGAAKLKFGLIKLLKWTKNT